jgi:3-oxoacyl-[acyl-carrier protein] reductase
MKTVLITGASSGIGAVTAKMFAQKGLNVAITYNNNKTGAEEVALAIQDLGAKSFIYQAELSQEESAKNLVESVLNEFQTIDVLVNNAGGYLDGDEWDGPSEIWVKSLEQNLVSVMSVSKYVIPVFQKQQSGVMINISSRHGADGQYEAISYAAAKAGVINITQAYAKLLAPYARANSVSPSATDAGYWLTAPKEELEETLANRPNHKLVAPETVAEKIVFLASDEANDITGQNFPVKE